MSFIIAVDGPTASGKGTLAKHLARYYGLHYLDTGLLYRALAAEALAQGLSLEKTESTIEHLEAFIESERFRALLDIPSLSVVKKLEQKKAAFHVSDTEPDYSSAEKPDFSSRKAFSSLDFCSGDLRSGRVSEAASILSVHAKLRNGLKEFQKRFSQKYPGSVLDGRDIGTVICPEADVKLYVTASQAVRAQRRFQERKALGEKTSFEETLSQLEIRDARDQNRENAPLQKAMNAFVIDTTTQTEKKVFECVKNMIDPLFKSHTSRRKNQE